MRAKPGLLLFSLLISQIAKAQVRDGFVFLQDWQFMEAMTAFENDLHHRQYGAAAQYGLALLQASALSETGACLAALEHIEQAEALAKTLKPGKKQSQIKRGWLPKDNFRQLQKTVLDSLTAFLDRAEDLEEVHAALDFEEVSRARRFRGNVRTALDQARQRAVAKALREAEDYPTLHALATRHRHIVVQNHFLLSGDLDQRLISAFIQDYGETELERFVRENPEHYISMDCWVRPFIATARQSDISGMLDFIHDYPLSVLSQLAYWWLQERLPLSAGAANFTPRQQKQLDVLAASKKLSAHLQSDWPLDNNFHAEAMAYIEQTAPSTHAYYFMTEVLQRYLKSRQWDLAEDLAVRCQPWFPDEQPADCKVAYDYYSDKQQWFQTAIPILQRPAEGLRMEPVHALNTFQGDEYSPVISADGRTLYFAGAGRPDNIRGEDMFVAYWQKEDWSAPRLVKNLSGEGNFVPLSLTNDGRQMLVFVDGKLHISQKETGGWGTPQEIPGITAAFPWIGRAVFADNGRVLILAASTAVAEIERNTNTELFVAIKNPYGQWEPPFSIGTVINTPGQERSPFLHADGRSLYFSSNGQDGLGKMDVYKTVRLSDTWKDWAPPINMGKEINTLEDEMGYNYAISGSGTSAYLAMTDERNRRYDLYATSLPGFVRPKPQTVITLRLEQEGKAAGALPVIVKDADGTTVGRALSHPDGTVELVIPANARGPLSITTPSPDKAFLPLPIHMDSTATLVAVAQPVEVFPAGAPCRDGRYLQTRGVLFEKGAHALSAEALNEIKAIYNLINCPQLPAIEVAGFADPDGSDALNLELSQRRAESVRQALIALGYPAGLITAKGYGKKLWEGRPAQTEAEKAACRKVEIRVGG